LTTGGTPRATVGRLSTALQQVLAEPAIRAAIEKQGITPAPNTAEEFAALIKSDIAKWTKVVRAAGIKAE
jgi:tripartite-type tricarboxylate transporter receptor subunit TctC